LKTINENAIQPANLLNSKMMHLIPQQEIPHQRKLCLLILAFCFFLLPVTALRGQEKTVTYYLDPASTPADLPITLHHLKAWVSFVPEKNMVNGKAEFTFTWNRPQSASQHDTIVFHTPGFVIHSVTLDSLPVTYRQAGPSLIIYPQPVSPRSASRSPSFRITYTATPSAGYIYFIGWRPDETGKRKQIWAHRPHGWIPYMDGRITVDMFVTFDHKYKVFSNGERYGIHDNKDGTKTWHYTMKKDHPFFSTALVIGDYNYTRGKTARGVPLEFWYYPDMSDRISTTYRYTERMFDFLEKELQFNYPYPLYREAPVIDYMYGAMETTTSTVFGDYMQITPRSWWQRNYVNVNAHELAHQWFGNCIAHLVNKDVWLTESFATFYAKLFEKKIYGEDYWQNIRNDEMNLSFEAAKKNDYPVGGSQGGVQRIYQKGSLVLEMLRNLMGEEQFRKAVNLYLSKYAFGYAETSDFIRCVYDAGSKPYNWFFDQWILRGGEPDYLVTDSVSVDSTGLNYTVFRVRQVQPVTELQGLFRMPVCFEVHYTDGSYDSLVSWIEKQETFVKVPNPQKKSVDYLLFDPNRTILKKVTFIQSSDRLKAQALNAKNMIDRYDALVSLRKVPLSHKLDALSQVYARETFHLTKSEILFQIEGDTTPPSLEIKQKTLKDALALVRKSALLVLNPVPINLKTTVEAMLYDSSFVNVELALHDLCRSFPDQLDRYLDQTKDMEGWRGKNIRMKWLGIALGAGKREFLPEVIEYCSPRYEFETRMNAFNLLKDLAYHDEKTMEYAEQAANHWNNKLSAVAKEYLRK
jgi:aminopeptidase N